MSTGPQLVPTASRPPETEERNWLPMVIAAAVVVLVGVVAVLVLQHGRTSATVTPISATPDPYAATLPISALAMSESSNLAGGKVTYLDGHIANTGSRTVTGITVQVLFHTFAHEVAQNDTESLKIIRMRDPYIDVEPVSQAPIAPGGGTDFRLIFDGVSPDWDGAYPEIRVVHVETR